MTHKENDDNVQPQVPAFVPRRRFEDEDLEDDDVKDDWEEEDEEPKPAPAPAPEPKKRLSVKQKIAEKEAMKQNNTVSSNAQVAINK